MKQQPGNSGGALVDAAGNVVGIVSAKVQTHTTTGGRRPQISQMAQIAITNRKLK